jgi:hypothetical protein
MSENIDAENRIMDSSEHLDRSSPKPSILHITEIGSGVTICDFPYDDSKYDRLVEELHS